VTAACAAVLFDLDGTLADTAPAITRALNATLVEHDLAAQSEPVVRGWIGGGVELLLTRAMHAFSLDADDAAARARLMGRFAVHYRDCLADGVAAYPGMVDLLHRLRDDGTPLGMVTNKPREFAVPLLEVLQLAPLFSAIVCGDDLPRRKPDPLPVSTAASALGVAAGSSWMVGDSLADVRSANQAGCVSVLMAYGYGSDDPQAVAQARMHALDVAQLRSLLYPR